MPSGSGFAQLSKSGKLLVRSDFGAEPEQPQHSLREDAEAEQSPAASLRPRVSFVAPGASVGVAQEPEDEEEDDRDSVIDSQVIDSTYNMLVQYVYDKYDESCPLSDSSASPRCDFESYFAVSELQSLAQPRMRVYPRPSELLSQSSDCSAEFAHESKPLHKVIPLWRHLFPIPDEPDFASLQWLNPDFARITGNKTITKTRVGTATFADLEKVEKCSRALAAGQSQSYLLLLALLSQLKQDGFQPSDPLLFDKTILALSASFATQTSLYASLTDFIMAKRCESFLAHVTFPVSEPQKCELLVSPGTDAFLFDQLLLEKVSEQLKDSMSLSKLSKSAGRSKPAHAANQRYASPLDFSRPGSSGYRICSVSPARGSASKRDRDGRGVSPSTNSCKGFRK